MLSFYEFSNIKILFNIHTNDILLYRLVLIIYIYIYIYIYNVCSLYSSIICINLCSYDKAVNEPSFAE